MVDLNLETLSYGQTKNYTSLDSDTLMTLLKASDNVLPYLINVS
jgi:hypothetical protein